MRLLIAEKKLAAYAYARALTNNYKEFSGYLEGDNDIIIVWCQGHLLKYVDPDEMNEEWEVWSWENLPILPDKIPLKPIKGLEKQLYLIQSLAKRCTELINALDIEPEGAGIYQNVINFLKLEHMPSKRLWTTSLQATAIREAYASLRDPEELTSLVTVQATRSKLDYLVGINLTRCVTLVGDGKTLPMGRLISSCLSLVNNREKARADFQEESYYSIKGEFQIGAAKISANYAGERITSKEQLDDYLTLMNQNEGTLDFTDELRVQLPPMLLNHTDVLVIIHQRYGLKPKETSEILQNLYLKGLVSYPRSRSRFVTKDEIMPMREAFLVLRVFYPNLAKGADINQFNIKNERLVNTVSEHHAIIPTAEVPVELCEEEKWVYQLILERFFLQTQMPHKSEVRSVSIQYSKELKFKTSFKLNLDAGWKGLFLNFAHDEVVEEVLDDLDESETIVESFQKLDKSIPVKFVEASSKTCTTSPQPSYTEGTLMKQMENISNVVENPKYKKVLKGCGLGTSATRAETIQKLQDIGYLSLEKKKLVVSPLGESVMSLLNFEQARLITSPEMTALWELALEEIKGGNPPEEFEKGIISFITAFVKEMEEQGKRQVKVFASEHKCPECAGYLKTTKKVYNCVDCDFFIWRSQYFKMITPKMVEDLLEKGETATLSFKSKDKKSTYKAKLTLPIENGKVKMTFI